MPRKTMKQENKTMKYIIWGHIEDSDYQPEPWEHPIAEYDTRDEAHMGFNSIANIKGE